MPETIAAEDVQRTPVAKIKASYIKISDAYNKLLNGDIVFCTKCGRPLAKTAFYQDSRYANHLYPICKECLLNIVGNRKTSRDEYHETKESIKKVLQMLDKPFINDLYESCKRAVDENTGEREHQSVFTAMLPQYTLTQYRNLKWKDSDPEALEAENQDNYEGNQKLINRGRKRFGKYYNNQDLEFLETQYEDWESRYEIKLKAQEVLLQRICCKQLELEHAQRAGKDTSKLDKDLQDLMSSLNVKPSQSAADQLTDNYSLGQLINLWEMHDPIGEPSEEFKDPDHMVVLVDGFIRGHTAKMMGIKNAFSQLYDRVMHKYSVQRHIDEDEASSDDIFDRLFGKKVNEDDAL